MGKIKENYACSLVLMHDLIGGKWKLRVLWHIIHGDNRFSMLLRAIPDITQKVLSDQLNQLEKSGLINKHVIDDKPPKVIAYSIAKEYEDIIDLIEHTCRFTKQYAKKNGIMIDD